MAFFSRANGNPQWIRRRRRSGSKSKKTIFHAKYRTRVEINIFLWNRIPQITNHQLFYNNPEFFAAAIFSPESWAATNSFCFSIPLEYRYMISIFFRTPINLTALPEKSTHFWKKNVIFLPFCHFIWKKMQ